MEDSHGGYVGTNVIQTQICRESRHEAFRRYKPAFAKPLALARIYFDYKTEALLIGRETLGSRQNLTSF
jgi:hypothetical protein